MFYGIVVTLSILYRAIKRISSNLSKVRREKIERGKKEAMWWKDEKYLELSRNLHNSGIPSARVSELVSISRAPVAPSIAINTAALHFASISSYLNERHLLHSTAERETTARSSSIAPTNSYTWNVDRCYLNCRGLTRTTENSIVYVRVCHIRNIVWVFFTTNTIHTDLFG